ncbi:MAG: right-handed parallel beta-helix repeat-containing protein [Crenarchaeota archaeon]|nr:right-handed parallel beta-helix repeat-containing protein [Thermoproteota archaeon]MCR8471169.1 right-handed parallel beta-helix repeat-containing protein [Thermoproteota archaeon]MCR8488868.1 right-handed parallel beta-helix repeat-containing protein [Thermoproteota archaeon]
MNNKVRILALSLLVALVLMPLQTVAATYNTPEKTIPTTITHEPINTESALYSTKAPREIPLPKLRNLDDLDTKIEQAPIGRLSKPNPPTEPKGLTSPFPNTIVIPAGNTTIITGNQTYTDTGFEVYGNLTIVDANVIFNGTSGIIAKNGSIVKIVNSKITYDQTPTYIIEAEANTTITVEGGEIVGCTDFSTGHNYEDIGVRATLTIKNSKLIDTPLYAMYSEVTVNDVVITAKAYSDIICFTAENSMVNIANINFDGEVYGSATLYGIYLYGTDGTVTGINMIVKAYESSAAYGLIIDTATITLENVNFDGEAYGAAMLCGITLYGTDGTMTGINMIVKAYNESYVNGLAVDTATVTLENPQIEMWTYGLSSGDIIAPYLATINVIGGIIKFHPYEGTSWASIVFIYGAAGTVNFDGTEILIDAYGYGGDVEYESYLIIPFYAYPGSISFKNVIVNTKLRGFAFVYYFIYGRGAGTVEFTTSVLNVECYEESFIYYFALAYGKPVVFGNSTIDIKCDGASTIYAFAYPFLGTFKLLNSYVLARCFGVSLIYTMVYMRGGTVIIDNSKVLMYAYGGSVIVLVSMPYTPAVPGVYNITNSIIGGETYFYGLTCNQDSVYIENVTLFGFDTALVLQSVKNAVVRNCVFKDNTRAMGIGGGSGVGGEILIEGCVFKNIREFNIDASYSANVKIIGCSFEKTIEFPIYFVGMENVTLVNNTMTGLSPVFIGTELKHFSTHKIEGNKVNGKDILYLVNETNKQITEEYAAIILAGTSNITISGLKFLDVTAAITIAFSGNIIVDKVSIDSVKYGVYTAGSNVTIRGSKIFHAERGVLARVGSKVTVESGDIRYSANGILAEDSEVFVNKTQFYQNGFGIVIIGFTGGKLEVMNSVILMSAEHGISVTGNVTAVEVHYCSIYSNRMHGIYSTANITINASYNWWGVDNTPPEREEIGDPMDPEEVWGTFTSDTFEKPLKEAMWSPSEEGVIPVSRVPTIPNYVLLAVVVIIGVIAAIVIMRRRA